MSEPIHCKDGSILNQNYEEEMASYIEEKLKPAADLLLDCLEQNGATIPNQTIPSYQGSPSEEGTVLIKTAQVYEVDRTGSVFDEPIDYLVPFRVTFHRHGTDYEYWKANGSVIVKRYVDTSVRVPIYKKDEEGNYILDENGDYIFDRYEYVDETEIVTDKVPIPADLSYQFTYEDSNSLGIQINLKYDHEIAGPVNQIEHFSIPARLHQQIANLHNSLEWVEPGEEVSTSSNTTWSESIKKDLSEIEAEEDKYHYLAAVAEGIEVCQSQVDSYLELWNERPQLCISEEEITDEPVEITPPKPEESKPPIDPCVFPEGEKWGVRFRYRVGPNANACIPNQAPREGLATGTATNNPLTSTTSYEERDWFLTLLPAMKSVFPGQMDVPGAMPGLQFRVFSNIAKHRVPGFQPIYQHLGVEATYITMVGTFTGDGGLGKVKEVQETMGNLIEAATESDIIIPGAQAGSSATIEQRSTNTPLDNEEIGLYNLDDYQSEVNSSPTGSDTSETTSTQVSQDIEDNYDNYALYKVVVDRAEVWDRYPSGRRAQPLYNTFMAKGETVLVVETRGEWSLTSQGYWIHNSHIRQITNTAMDIPVGRNVNEYTPSSYKEGKYFQADACMTECPNEHTTPGSIGLNDWHKDFYDPDWTQSPTLFNRDEEDQASRPGVHQVWEIAQKLDSYHEFVSFYKLAVQQGNELEVEINTRKYQDGLHPVQGLIDDPLRNRENGNPKFKGFLRKMEVYQARTDRTWYLMEFEVTDHALSGYQPINLTHDLNAAIKAAMEERDVALEEQVQESEERNNDISNYVKVYVDEQGRTVNAMIPGASKTTDAGVAYNGEPGHQRTYYLEYEDIKIEIDRATYDSLHATEPSVIYRYGAGSPIPVEGDDLIIQTYPTITLSKDEYASLPNYQGVVIVQEPTDTNEEEAAPVARVGR